MRLTLTWILGGSALALASFTACGGTTDSGGGGGGGGSGGDGGSSAADSGSDASAGSGGGGAGGSGGVMTGGTAGVAGNAGAGAAAGAGGSSATGGSAGGGGAGGATCAPPSAPGSAALCVSLAPETITFGANPALDGMGLLAVRVFDVADPDPPVGPEPTPVAERLVPPPPGDGGLPAEISVTDLPEVRFELPPGTYYVQSYFIDNRAALGGGDTIVPGTWIGGYDLSLGFVDQNLQATTLVAGQGTPLVQPLTAIRALRVDVSLASGVALADDGQGPLTIGGFHTPTPGASTPLFGIGGRRCVDLSSGSAQVPAAFVGSGELWVVGVLDDLNLGGNDLPPGSVSSLALGDGGIPVVPTSITTSPTDYSAQVSLVLGRVEPAVGDGGAAPYACPAPDAGAD